MNAPIPQDDPYPFLLTVPEVAGFLRTSEVTVRRLIRSGALEALRLGEDGGHYRVSASSLRRFFERYHIDTDRALFEARARRLIAPRSKRA